MRKDIEVVGGKMTKHSDECGQHLQAQNIVCNMHVQNGYMVMHIPQSYVHVYVYTCMYMYNVHAHTHACTLYM